MKAKTSNWKMLAVVLGVVALACPAGAAPVTWTEDFESGYTDGQELKTHADWFYEAGHSGPKSEDDVGIGGT